MICYERNCIFVHIPKTGGTSIEDAIWGPDRGRRSEKHLWMGMVDPLHNKYQTGGLQHLLATQIRAEVGEAVFDRCYRFAFVRNPWAKVVSQYYALKHRPKLAEHMGLARSCSFQDYVRCLARHHERHVQSCEQWRFVLDDDGSQLVDFLGRFETLAEDFRTVAHAIGLDHAVLPHAMKSSRLMPWRQHYDPQSTRLVAEIYARDIQLFGYDFFT